MLEHLESNLPIALFSCPVFSLFHQCGCNALSAVGGADVEQENISVSIALNLIGRGAHPETGDRLAMVLYPPERGIGR